MFYYMCNSYMAKYVWNFVHNCQKLKDFHSKFVNFALICQFCTVLTLPSTKINTAAASNNSSLVKIRFSKSFNKKIRFATLVKSPSTVMAMLHLTGRRTPFHIGHRSYALYALPGLAPVSYLLFPPAVCKRNKDAPPMIP